MRSRMRESASTDLREPQGSNPLGPPGPELPRGSPDHAVRPAGGLQVTRRRSGSRASETPSGPGAVCMPLALSMDDHVPIAITEGTRRSVPEGDDRLGSREGSGAFGQTRSRLRMNDLKKLLPDEKHFSAVDLRKLPADERSAIFAALAE